MTGLRLVGIRPKVLDPVDLTITRGDLVLLSGASGSGKSLLLRAIADLDPHDGEVWLDDTARSALAAPDWRKMVGLLPAEAHWWGETVGDHFAPDDQTGPDADAAPAIPARAPPPTATAVLQTPTQSPAHSPAPKDPDPAMALTALLQRLDFGPDVLDWAIARLSTGERQRLSLARLLANRPHALLLDEATANLDPPNRDRVEALIDDYRTAHAAPILWVSHDPEQRQRLAGRRLLIRDGRLEPET